MHTYRRNLAIAGVVAAAAIAVPSAAFASGWGAPSGKPASPPACVAPVGKGSPGAFTKPGGPALTVPGLSAGQLQAGLAAAKKAGGDTSAGVAAFAAAAGVSHATAERVVQTVFGPQHVGGAAGGPQIPAAFAAALAKQLGVSTSAAQHALDQIVALGRGGIDPTSPAFAAVAQDLGVTPDRLNAALMAAKQSLAGQAGSGSSGQQRSAKPGSAKAGYGKPGSGEPGPGQPGSCQQKSDK